MKSTAKSHKEMTGVWDGLGGALLISTGSMSTSTGLPSYMVPEEDETDGRLSAPHELEAFFRSQPPAG